MLTWLEKIKHRRKRRKRFGSIKIRIARKVGSKPLGDGEKGLELAHMGDYIGDYYKILEGY